MWLLATRTVPGIRPVILRIEEEAAVRWLILNGDKVPPAVSARVMIDAPLAVPPEAPSGSTTPRANEAAAGRGLSAENRAMAIALQWVKEGRPLRIPEIADEVPCSPSYLYR